jgi:phenylalanyl-tRNA synthetase alpha chain
MTDDISPQLAQAKQDIERSATLAQLDTLRVHILGKKGFLTEALKTLGALPADDRKAAGQIINQAKQELTELLEAKKVALSEQDTQQKLAQDALDITLPGRHADLGSLHPITKTRLRLEHYFQQLGFDVETGPHIETDYYNFEALNIPASHPARAMQDTFYFPNGTLLRTHTSPVQIRYMQSTQPPFRMVATGRVYRCDSDVTHTPMFHQIEGLVVEKHLTMAHLKTLLQEVMRAFFEFDCHIRFRSSYFPFTEPSAEVDVSCVICQGKKMGCRVCKETGWLEVLGCGMIHPNVLKAGGVDSEIYNGFAFGMGLERLTMLRYQVGDIRQYFENDTRFLSQWSGV